MTAMGLFFCGWCIFVVGFLLGGLWVFNLLQKEKGENQ